MKNVILMAVLVASGVLLAALQNSLVKKNIKKTVDSFAYSAAVYAVGSIIMYIDGGRFECAPLTKILGLASGFLIISETVCSVNALRYGPMSLTIMLSMSSMVVPMIPAGILWNEPMTGLQIVAAVLMLLAMALILNLFGSKKEKKTYGSIDKRWIIFGSLCFLSGGLMGFPQKYQTMSAYSGEIISYLLYAFLTASVLSAGCMLFTMKKTHDSRLSFTGKLLPSVAVCGILTAMLYILTMEAMNVIPISVVLTVSNGGRLILVTLVDILYFKQPLGRQQAAGIALGVISILLLSI